MNRDYSEYSDEYEGGFQKIRRKSGKPKKLKEKKNQPRRDRNINREEKYDFFRS